MSEFLIGLVLGVIAATVGMVHVARRYQDKDGRTGELVRWVLFK